MKVMNTELKEVKMKKLETIINKITIILITISLVVFSAIPNTNVVYAEKSTADLQKEIVDFALSYSDQNTSGTPKPTNYVWGGTSLTNGADCSGFVMAVFKSFGYNLNLITKDEEGNSRAAAMSRTGQQVSYSEVQLGDIIVVKWTGSGWSWHCGIYAGNGQYVNCSSSKGHAILSNVPTGNVYAVTRVIGNVNGGNTSPVLPSPGGPGGTGGIGGSIVTGFKPQGEIDNTDNDPIDLDALEFDFSGSPSKMEYNGEKHISVWLFSKFSQFIDYILGIMLQGIKGAVVGWTAIIEGIVNDALNMANNEI